MKISSLFVLKCIAFWEFSLFSIQLISQRYILAMITLCVLFFIAIVHYEMTHKYG